MEAAEEDEQQSCIGAELLNRQKD